MNTLDDVIRFNFVGGNLAMDFCNTVAGDRAGVPREYLNEPVDFIGWSQQAGLLTGDEAERALARAQSRPEEARELLGRAIALREAMFRLLNSCRSDEPAPKADLAVLTDELAKSMHRLSLAAPEDHEEEADSIPCHYEWKWKVESDSLDQPFGPIAHAAANLLTQPDGLRHVGMCQGDNCGWLFIDTSKNHSRCWCDMRDCGNRAKIRRHRMKNRAGG